MTKRPKCKTRGCSHRAAAKPSIKAVEAHPDAMEALAAMRAWGAARAAEREADRLLTRMPNDSHWEAWGVAADALDEAEHAAGQLADRLAARKGE